MAKIVYNGQEFESVRCKECGGRIAPASALVKHVMRHRQSREYMRRVWLAPLRKALKASRL